MIKSLSFAIIRGLEASEAEWRPAAHRQEIPDLVNTP